ncbi:MAG: DMT family transporter [Parcubacteria group bacterium]|nr:DMT family transporter [Parcubacteria group bacterium]
MDSAKSKGNLLALISSLFQASVLVFWTYLLGLFSRPVLMIYWFGAAAFILLGYLFFTKNLKFKFSKKLFPILLVFGFLSALTTFLLMTSAKMVGASITSFIMQTTVIFALMYSIFGLKEKFTKKELVGIIFIAIGLFVLNWKANLTIALSSLIVVFAALSQSTNHFLAKKLLPKVPKLQLNLIRIFCILLFGMIYLFIVGETLQPININVLLILILGVLLGPIFIYVFYYSAIQKTNLATANALKNISPIFTFILASLFLGELLTLQQTIAFISLVFGAYLIFKK